ncbi:hypothetical protein AB0J81_09225 [Streptomyces bobili]|uniref:hypothetical protein n=1 Tax=Streptomyces bobili TaxID=67280 RepID=UPI003412A6C8
MSTEQGADELRVRALLLAREVGPDAVLPMPAARPRDWLDEIVDTDLAPAVEKLATPTPEPEPLDEEPADVPAPVAKTKPKPAHKPGKKRKKSKPGAARAAVDTRPDDPRQSLAEAWDRVPYRLKWLAYHASAAYLGWTVGLVNWATYVTAWIAATGLLGPQALFWYAAAGGTVLIYRRTRGWWRPVAWLAAVPATSTVVGVLLYAPHP